MFIQQTRVGATLQRRILASVLPSKGVSLSEYVSQAKDIKKKIKEADAIAEKEVERISVREQKLAEKLENRKNVYSKKQEKKDLLKMHTLSMEMETNEDITPQRREYYKNLSKELLTKLTNLQ